MHDETAEPLLSSLAEDERFASWHLALRDGSLTGHGTGLVALLRSMHLSRAVGRLLTAIPEGVLETLYGFVASHRGFLGRLVPDGPSPRRYP